MKTRCLLYSFCLASALITACSDSKKNVTNEEEGTSTVLPETQNDVTVMTLTSHPFNHELVSNGKVNAKASADLHFVANEVIAHVYVKNGDRVHKGQKIAELDLERLKNRLAQAKNALERARLDLRDVLIGQGYATDDFSKIPKETMSLATVKSGYEQSKLLYEQAKLDMSQAILVAPFNGIVANLFTKAHNMANSSNIFCTIIDTQGMEAEFSVLESELSLVKPGDQVVIRPYADASSTYQGRVSEINPLVDTNGMVKVKARVDGKGRLFSGMNIRVGIHRSMGKQLVIPKSAVVLRSGKQVVFTLQNGKAKWNYVQTGFENADSCVVLSREESQGVDGLAIGDQVITSGNVNLAHESPVVVTNASKK